MYLTVFTLVRNALLKISKVTGFTYQEVNIIVYFFLIPFSWACLLDIIYGSYSFSVALLVIIITLSLFRKHAEKLFILSVMFLLYFQKANLNYERASVWICVWLPLIIYAILITLAL